MSRRTSLFRDVSHKRLRRVVMGIAVNVVLVAGCTGSGASGSSATSPAAARSGAAAGSSVPAPGTSADRSGEDASSPAAPAYYRQRLEWRSCGEGLDCATLHVPLDYSAARSPLIDVAVIRRPATTATGRIGALVVNPGGPGVSAVDFVRGARFSATVRAHFDVVGFDPRGTGQTTPIRCVDGPTLDELMHDDPSPDTPAERARLVADNRAFARACAERSGLGLLAHVGTRDTARDMDVLRAALGEPKLDYLGYSYGTFLGATYAELFPTRIRAMVLDGAVDPALSAEKTARQQALGFERDLADFLADCAGRARCPVDDASLSALLRRIDADGLPAPHAPGQRRLGPGEAFFGLAAGLYSPASGWPALRAALAAARAGDGSGLLELSDSLVDRNADGSYGSQVEAGAAIGCLDRPEPQAVSAYQADAEAWASVAPHFGAAEAWGGLACAFWPVPAQAPPHPIHAAGAPPILVVGTTGDPATPYAWAQALASQLDSGRLLTYTGDGHTAYRASGNRCIRAAVEGFLVRLALPPVGTRCGG